MHALNGLFFRYPGAAIITRIYLVDLLQICPKCTSPSFPSSRLWLFMTRLYISNIHAYILNALDRVVDLRSINGTQRVKLENVIDAINLGTLLDGYAAADVSAIEDHKTLLTVNSIVFITIWHLFCHDQLESAEKVKTLTMKNSKLKFSVDAMYPDITKQQGEGGLILERHLSVR